MLSRFIDTLIAMALVVGAVGYLSTDDAEETEAEFNPIDAKIQKYCENYQFNPQLPPTVREACQNRRLRHFEINEDIPGPSYFNRT